MGIIELLKSFVVVDGKQSVQPLPSSAASTKHRLGHLIENNNPINAFTDTIFQTAPVGYNIPNPVNIEFNIPKQQTVMKTPSIKNDGGVRGDCK